MSGCKFMPRARRSVTHPQDGQEKVRKERWIYVGRRRLEGGGLGCLYLKGKKEEERLYPDKHNIRGVIGGVYEVKVIVGSDTRQIKLPMRYIEPSGDDRTAEWQAQDKTVMTQREIDKKMDKDKKEDKLGELTLRELQGMYHMQPATRAGLLGLVFNYITKGSRSDFF